jgi:outer membrane protein TolC
MSLVNRSFAHLLHHTLIGTSLVALSVTGGSLAQEKAPPPAAVKVSAPSVQNFTLDEAINYALENQPTIHAAHASLNSSRIAKSVTDNPLVGFMPGGNLRRSQASMGLSAASANVQQVEMEIKNAVNRTYLGVIYARAQLLVAQNAVETLKATHKVADQLVKSGDSKKVTQDDVDKLSIFVMLAESRIGEAQVGMDRAKAALREAMGLSHDAKFDIDQGSLTRFYDIAQEYTRTNKVRLVCEKATDMATTYRPELAQASLFSDIVCLEAQAQSRAICHFGYVKTFAASSDIHSKILPSQVINGEYKPGPVGPEMPTFLVGNANQRGDRARALFDRSIAVSDKARGLVALEAEEGCARLNRAADQIELLKSAGQKSDALYKKAEKNYRQDQLATADLLQAYVLDATNKSSLNEAYYQFGMTLAYLQRATAGHLWECFEKQ